MEQELQVTHARLINDFVAVGYGILGLSDQDLHTLQPGECNANAPIAMIGAGTGLGQGFVIPQPKGYRVFATEGGHVDFAPRSELEFELLRYLQQFSGDWDYSKRSSPVLPRSSDLLQCLLPTPLF